MNISGKNIASLLKTYTDKVQRDGNGETRKSAESGKQERTDEVRLSEFSRDVQRIQEGLEKIRDVREEKVRELQTRVESGSYDVSGRDIAEKMIERVQKETR